MWRITLKNHRQTGRLQNRPVFFWGARGRESGIWNILKRWHCDFAWSRGSAASRLAGLLVTCNMAPHGCGFYIRTRLRRPAPATRATDPKATRPEDAGTGKGPPAGTVFNRVLGACPSNGRDCDYSDRLLEHRGDNPVVDWRPWIKHRIIIRCSKSRDDQGHLHTSISDVPRYTRVSPTA